MNEAALSFTLLYDWLVMIFGQIPEFFKALFSLPLLLQQGVSLVIFAASATIFATIIIFLIKFCKWWVRVH